MWTTKSLLSSSSSVVRFPNIHHVIVVVTVCIFGQLLCTWKVEAQTTNATTDPSEVQTINLVFQKWGIPAEGDQWNISGDPCSRAAIEPTSFNPDSPFFWPGNPVRPFYPYIGCDCSYDNNTTCHIIQLEAYGLSLNGTIPDELWNLTYLITLNLANNLLTGSLSPAITKLTQVQYMTFGTNNFSGSLPSEIGNLRKLEIFFVDSSGFSGEIPTTFANLQSLRRVLLHDNAFTGKMPDFIGSWSNLIDLSIQGNSFKGPIPTTISNLTLLTYLRISDVINGSSSLEFIKGLTNLKNVVLRNNNISDSIPSYIGDYRNLSELDLSFNNLVGPIPNALMDLNLTTLFLGNNSLNGTLPTRINSLLNTLDLSYNDLTGSLPAWVDKQNLQINLVGNNLMIDYDNIRFLPAKLNCLQRNFRCNNTAGIYNNFSINCGGLPITTNGTMFKRDTDALGPATYFVSNSETWAVSNVGNFYPNNNPTYTLSLSESPSTLDSPLFQTARISASSLRYYGLGLKNGNYNVTLQFAEIKIQNSIQDSLRRRIFDIYIQGTLVAKDFDIRKEGGGSSFVVVKKDFIAHVTQNYLEIHLFWTGKGLYYETYGPLISAISVNPDSISNYPLARSNKGDQVGTIVGIVVGVGVASLLVLLLMFYTIRQRRKAQAKKDKELLGIDGKLYIFNYGELRAATEDFNPINKLGEGGFGPVFKGMLNDGRVIAVKQLSLASHQGNNHFIAETATISAVQHRNLVKLYGCCIKGNQRLLVYEYLENKSLDQALFGERSLALEWGTRYEICLGVAKGLAYLHEESRLRIVHRDVKASNILLGSDFVPKISDFGLAKLYDDNKTHISTRVAGTIGYLAPEYAMRGHLTEKADVFAFGVVALEIVSGRPNSDLRLKEDNAYLLELAWQLHETNQVANLVDSRLSSFNEEEVKRVVEIALLCTQTSPTIRPSMSRVVAMLSGDIEVSNIAIRPGYLTDWKFRDQTSSMSEITIGKGVKESSSSKSLSSRTIGGANLSPINTSNPLLSEIFDEGR